jgi:YcaO-like protein with predicted kinase domain
LPAGETLARTKHLCAGLGITRLARLTGLDRIGIPVWAAIRPNARTLSVSQGKGLDDDSAAVSALMEALELAFAERPHPCGFTAPRAQLAARGDAILPLRGFLRHGEKEPGPYEEIRWVEGFDLIAGDPIFVPEEIIRIDDSTHGSRHPFWQSSDGLGAGNTLTEAIVHGLCERIERDAVALWSFRSAGEVAAKEVTASSLGDPSIRTMADRIAGAGLRLRLFDIATDLTVPAYLALIVPCAPEGLPVRYLELASGSGAHPVPQRAAVRAITEAAQTRLTTISGSRDDFDPDIYRQSLPSDLTVYLAPARSNSGPCRSPIGYSGRSGPGGDLAWLLTRLEDAGIRSVVVVSFETEAHGVALARVLVPELEDDPRAKHRQLRRRALRAMLGAR